MMNKKNGHLMLHFQIMDGEVRGLNPSCCSVFLPLHFSPRLIHNDQNGLFIYVTPSCKTQGHLPARITLVCLHACRLVAYMCVPFPCTQIWAGRHAGIHTHSTPPTSTPQPPTYPLHPTHTYPPPLTQYNATRVFVVLFV